MLRSGAVLAFALALPALSAVAACSEDAQTVKPQKATKGDDDDDNVALVDAGESSSSSSSSGGGLIDAANGGVATSYRGVLDKTPPVKFGGGTNHCNYTMFMSTIEIELAITPEGNVIGGTAKNDMTEAFDGACTFAVAPLGKRPLAFVFGSMSGQTLTFAQTPTAGTPKTNLTIVLTKAGQSFTGAVAWERADRTDDLKWTVTTTLTLGPK